MRLIACTILLVLSFSKETYAENFGILGGEHDTFTRLVIYADRELTWEVFNSEIGLIISFDGYSGGFEASRAMERLNRSRIKNIITTGNKIEILSDCKCKTSITQSANNLLIMDIIDEEQNQVFEDTMIPTETSEREATAISIQTNTRQFMQAPLSIDESEEENSNVDNEIVKRFQRSFLENLSVKMSSGVLDAKNPTTETEHEKITAPSIDEINNILRSLNLDAENQFSQQNNNSENSEFLGFDYASTCDLLNPFDLSEWGKNGDFETDIALSLRELETFEEGTEIEKKSLENLAKTYLYFGFVEEALYALRQIGEKEMSTIVLETIADAFRHEKNKQDWPYETALRCKGPHQLWLFLSQTIESAERADFDFSNILFEFSRLPQHLRLQLGEKLSIKLRAIGEYDGEKHVLSILDRSKHSQNATPLDVALQRIDETVSEPISAGALLLLEDVEGQLANGSTIDPTQVELLAAVAHEHRDSPHSVRFQKAFVRSLSQSGQFQRAFDSNRVLDETLDALEAGEEWRYFFDLLTQKGSDFEFLQFFTMMTSSHPQHLSQTVVLSMAKRLKQLGFLTRPFLESHILGPRLLSVDANALDTDRPDVQDDREPITMFNELVGLPPQPLSEDASLSE